MHWESECAKKIQGLQGGDWPLTNKKMNEASFSSRREQFGKKKGDEYSRRTVQFGGFLEGQYKTVRTSFTRKSLRKKLGPPSPVE